MGYRIPDHYSLYLRSRYYSEAELLALIDHIPLHAARIKGKLVMKQSQTPADYWNPEYFHPPENEIALFFSTLWEDSWESPTFAPSTWLSLHLRLRSVVQRRHV